MIKKKTYAAPLTECVMVRGFENILDDLTPSSSGDGVWSQGGVGEGDDGETEDDGRANTALWDVLDNAF